MKMNEAHIKSAMSVKPYLTRLYKTADEIEAFKILGKPFGIPCLLKHLKYPDEIVQNGYLLREQNSDFDWVESTLGNSLGVAEGFAISNPDKIVWCFISDSQLFMGPTLEAILSIGSKNLKNIWLCIDYNKLGSKGKLPEFNFEGIFWNWDIRYLDVNDLWYNPRISNKPKVWIFNSYKLFKN